MPALPDRSGRAAAGHGRRRRHRRRLHRHQRRSRARPARRRGHAARGADARLRGLDAQRRDRPRRATSGARAELIERYGEETGRALYRETLDGYETVKRLIAEESIDCDFREVGHLELAYAAVARAATSSTSARAWPRSGVEAQRRPARAAPRGDRHRRLLRGARRPGQRPAPPGPLLRRAGRGGRPGRRRPPRGRPGPHDPAPGGRPVRRRDRARRDPRPRRLRRHQRLHRRRRPDACAAGSSRSAATSSPREPLPEDLVAELSPKGRAFFDTKNFLYYWHISADRRMVFGGRASILPTSIEQTAAILHRGPARGPPAAGRPADRLRLGRQRRLHVRPDAARRADDGRRRLRDGLLRDGRRADDPPRHAGRGVAGGRRGAGAGAAASSRWCRRRTRAGRGSCRSSASGTGSRIGSPRGRGRDEDRLPDVAAEHRLGEPRGGLGRGGPARRLRLGLAQRPPDRSRSRARRARASRR